MARQAHSAAHMRAQPMQAMASDDKRALRGRVRRGGHKGWRHGGHQGGQQARRAPRRCQEA
eukprot:6246454-Alexandrium_andersonii.AAC.1